MAREAIFGQLHPDVACAIALGIVENPQVTATLDSITVSDPRVSGSRTQKDWLGTEDPLDRLTREHFQARLEASRIAPRPGANGWAAASQAKARQEANNKALTAKAEAWKLLMERGVLAHAKNKGFRVLEMI